MSASQIDTLCATHRWSPRLAYAMANLFSGSSVPAQQPVAGSDAIKTILMGVGLLAIADVSTSARRLALRGNALLQDACIISAGYHKDHEAPRLNNGEYPACAAMTTGYVFRVENEATVHYLQRVGRTGYLTTISVASKAQLEQSTLWADLLVTHVPVLAALVLARLLWLSDTVGVIALLVYVFVRLINTSIVRRRVVLGWHGKPEPGVASDILVLLSQDRWIRLVGLTDDMKATLSGEWLRQSTFREGLATTITTMLSYFNVAIVAAATTEGQVLLLILIVWSTITLEVANELTSQLRMHSRCFTVVGRTKYERRLDMAEYLVKQTGRDDWAEKMGIVLTKNSSAINSSTGAAHI